MNTGPFVILRRARGFALVAQAVQSEAPYDIILRCTLLLLLLHGASSPRLQVALVILAGSCRSSRAC